MMIQSPCLSRVINSVIGWLLVVRIGEVVIIRLGMDLMANEIVKWIYFLSHQYHSCYNLPIWPTFIQQQL